jgi:GH24 family phage-related lysozyme (muramidase)
MTTLLALLKDREAYRLDVYLDSVGKPTVGLGHLVMATSLSA